MGIKLISNKVELNVGATSVFYNDGQVMLTNALKNTIKKKKLTETTKHLFKIDYVVTKIVRKYQIKNRESIRVERGMAQSISGYCKQLSFKS